MGDASLKYASDRERARSKYFLREGDEPEREVTEAEFIAAERRAGFVPKPGCGPLATYGFGYCGPDGKAEGRIEHVDETKDSGL